MEITRVEFTFSDGTTRVLEGEELDQWAAICFMKSDYLLPCSGRDVLAEGVGGLVRGFVPPEWIDRR